MGIVRFIYLLSFFGSLLLFFNHSKSVKDVDMIEQPKVSFFDASMYEITDTMVQMVVQSKKLLVYDYKEEFYDATIVMKQNNGDYINTISALNILKIKNDVEFNDDVYLQSSNQINIRTQQLHYNILTGIANSNTDFIARYNNNVLYGDQFIYNSKNNRIVANNTKFRIKVKNEEN